MATGPGNSGGPFAPVRAGRLTKHERKGNTMWRLTVVLGILCCASSLLVAQTKTSSSYELKTVDGIDGFSGSAAAKDLLERNGFVVTDRQFRQIFEAYTSGGLPKFITTDSAWHTYHVLLEDGVKRLEEIQAGRRRRVIDPAVPAPHRRANCPVIDSGAGVFRVHLGQDDGRQERNRPAARAPHPTAAMARGAVG